MSFDKYTFFYGSVMYQIPEYMRSGLEDYIDNKTPGGSFLSAVISNDLCGAVACADENNMRNLPAYANFLHNYAPYDCWGSLEKMNAWLEG